MQRAVIIVLAVALGGLALAGCRPETAALAPSTPAGPQRAELGWGEREPSQGPGLVFRVHRFAVTNEGWEAEIEIENRTSIEWEVSSDRLTAARSFGVMLFATGDLDELENRNRNADLPGLRLAQTFDPILPFRIEPGRPVARDDLRRGEPRGRPLSPGRLRAAPRDRRSAG